MTTLPDDDDPYEDLPRWVPDFIEGLRAGKSEVSLAKSLVGMPLAFVQALRDSKPAFARLWDAVKEDLKAAARKITPESLTKVLQAQNTDDRAAAYFGVKTADFKKEIESDPELQKIYETAREAGKALLQIAQLESALEGNWQALQWAGKQHLGQSDSAAPQIPSMTVNFNISNPVESYRQLLGGGTMVMPDITDIEVEENVAGGGSKAV